MPKVIKKKKKYEKPEVTRIRLDAKCAVLRFCKTMGSVGSGWSDCNAPAYCWSPGFLINSAPYTIGYLVPTYNKWL